MAARPYRRRPPTVDRATAEAFAHLTCHLHGCTCEPEVTVRHDGFTHVTVAHDSWCPMSPDSRRKNR
jgi:hypothetical protein